MSINVKDGTPLYGPSLCDSCAWGHIQKGYRISEETAVCTAYEPATRVPFRVRECTTYLDKNRENLHEMKKVAWLISPERGKNTTGFTRPADTPTSEDDIELILGEKS